MMATGEEIGFKVERLTGDNYHTWKFQMKMQLIGKNLWEIVTGDEVLGAQATALEQQKHKRRENQALASICLSVSTENQIYVRSAVTAKDAWNSLEQRFEKKSLAHKIFYRRKLYAAKMEKGTAMINHVNHIKTLAEHLDAVGDPIVEKDLVIILISSLPDEYAYLITALETIAEDRLTWDYVRDRVVHEYEKIHDHSQSGSGRQTVMEAKNEDALLTSKAQYQRRPINTRSGRCFYCGKKGHVAKNCYKKKADQKSSSAESANSVEEKLTAKNEDENALTACPTANQLEAKEWWIDSGASKHMTPNKRLMSNFITFKTPIQVKLADNNQVLAYGKGDLRFPVFDGSKRYNIFLQDVLYVPRIKRQLLSIPTMVNRGAEVNFKGNTCSVILDDKVMHIGRKDGILYKLNTEEITTAFVSSTHSGNDSIKLWHSRFAHLGYDNLKLLSNKSMVTGLNLNSKETFDRNCDGCAEGKQHRMPFPKKSEHRAANLLELIHSDVGCVGVESVGGSKYYVTFIDDYSRFTTVYFLKKKSEVLQKFKEFVVAVENHTGKRIKVIRTDNGGEYVSNEFKQFCIERGIKREVTIPMTPQQNGVSERMNRTIMESARSMLHHAKLPSYFWAEAVNTAVYIRNRCPTVTLDGITPYEHWFGRRPDVSNFRVFGCCTHVHIPDEDRSKLDKKSKKCIFVGYLDASKGYKLYDIERKVMIRSRDVRFLENDFDHLSIESENQEDYKELFNFGDAINEFELCNEETESLIEHNEVADEDQQDVRRSTRTRTVPVRPGTVTGDWWNDENLDFAGITFTDYDEPSNFNEAINSKHSSQWKDAITSEYESLKKNDTWELVHLPKGKNLVGNKWVFKVKRNADNTVNRFKARLVAQGFSQKEGSDYNEVFAPVARYNSIRTILSLVNALSLDLHQMDVKTAFLNGKLQEEIYMAQPEGCIDESNPDLVCKLKKSLYGLKQAAYCWNVEIDTFLKKSGYKQSAADSCIYTKVQPRKDGKSSFIILALYVDDILISSNDPQMLEAEKKSLSRRFEMQDLGDAKYCLGMLIQRDRDNKKLYISQKSYLESILKRFEMFESKPVATPMEVGKVFKKLSEDEEQFDIKQYQAAIGSLNYAMIATRPDICSAVGILSQFMSKPSKEHWQGVKRILRYIKGTLDYGLIFDANNTELMLSGYADADWASDAQLRKSTSGYIFQLAGSTISWRSQKQSVVALSTTEAEYVSLSSASQEAIWLRRLLKDLLIDVSKPTTIHEDNQGAICLTKNTKAHSRAKHIDIKYHFIREKVQNKEIELTYCPTDKMIADIFTKALPRPKFEELRSLMGIEKNEH
eukprot:gene16556-biopygen13988